MCVPPAIYLDIGYNSFDYNNIYSSISHGGKGCVGRNAAEKTLKNP